MNNRILIVDDEQKVLQGYLRNFGESFDIAVETSPEAALKLVKEGGPFAAVLSDFKMPEMDGVVFLSQVREKAPDTVRLMITGHAELENTIAAVNEGNIFRFFTKPCPAPELQKGLEDALRQYELVVAERELLDKTLKGSIQTLLEILSILNAAAFSLAQRRRLAVRTIAKDLGADNLWSIELAAMLCEIGIVTWPEDVVQSYLSGRPISAPHKRMIEELPATSAKLLDRIPRLEGVCEIIRLQNADYRSESGSVKTGNPTGKWIPIGARILGAINAYYRMLEGGQRPSEALDILTYSSVKYDPKIVSALRRSLLGKTSQATESPKPRPMLLKDLAEGITLRSDVRSKGGDLILRSGQTLGHAHIQRLRNFADSVGIQEPFLVEA